ncbi:transglycosylase SLT domain-containing protein [Desulfonema magnum]|nr:transglycosylase SLT domain-containing protein [Desulfonema magnum]
MLKQKLIKTEISHKKNCGGILLNECSRLAHEEARQSAITQGIDKFIDSLPEDNLKKFKLTKEEIRPYLTGTIIGTPEFLDDDWVGDSFRLKIIAVVEVNVSDDLKQKLLRITEAETIPPVPQKTDIILLLEATRNIEKARRININIFQEKAWNPADAMWPVYQFLIAECLRLRGETAHAAQTYRKLAIWASENPYNDGRGGSSLAALALWRWLKLMDETGADSNQVHEFLNVMEKLRKAILVKNVFKSPSFTELPQLEEDLLRIASNMAWSAGLEDQAGQLFLGYLKIARDHDFTLSEKRILKKLTDSGHISHQRLAFLRASRFSSLGKDEEACQILDGLQTDASSLTRAKALFEQAKIRRKSNKTKTRGVVVDILDKAIRESPDPGLTQKALYLRFKTLFREGPGRNLSRARQDISTMIQQYPTGKMTDDALYYMARHYQQTNQPDEAMDYYRQLCDLGGRTNWFNFSRFQPALILYAQGDSESLHQSEIFLEDLLSERPNGPLRLASMFWLGRIYEDARRKEDARQMFETIIIEAPYDYYAVRARMHLNVGRSAAGKIWPDAGTRRQLRSAYQKSRMETTLNMDSVYYQRLQIALESGLYTAALSADSLLRKAFPSRRLQNVSLSDIDASGLIAYTGLIMALRLDARSANALDKRLNSKLQIAGAVGKKAGDWPLTLFLAGYKPTAQKDGRFLATAYPMAYTDAFKKAGTANSVKPELLYSVVREESRFFPAAISSAGAMGLFQFLPSTFGGLLQSHKELSLRGSPSKEAFLLTPEFSLDLGGFWFGKELKGNHQGNILFSIMEHHAGRGAVMSWLEGWKAFNREDDVEYMAETVRYLSTRIFVRKVMRNMVIVNASGMF